MVLTAANKSPFLYQKYKCGGITMKDNHVFYVNDNTGKKVEKCLTDMTKQQRFDVLDEHNYQEVVEIANDLCEVIRQNVALLDGLQKIICLQDAEMRDYNEIIASYQRRIQELEKEAYEQ